MSAGESYLSRLPVPDNYPSIQKQLPLPDVFLIVTSIYLSRIPQKKRYSSPFAVVPRPDGRGARLLRPVRAHRRAGQAAHRKQPLHPKGRESREKRGTRASSREGSQALGFYSCSENVGRSYSVIDANNSSESAEGHV